MARGRYALPELPDALKAAARARGVPSHATAAQLLGLDMVFPPTRLDISVTHGARPPAQKIVTYHRRRSMPPWTPAYRTPTPDVTLQVVRDCASAMPFAEALAIADSALRAGLLTAEDLLGAAGSGPGRRRRQRVLTAASSLAANPFESALRGIVIETGLDLRPQLPIALPGQVIRVDLGDADRRLAIEADSFAWHGHRTALASDCRRYDELVRAGWTVLRFAWEHVMFEPAWIAEVVRDVYRRGTVTG